MFWDNTLAGGNTLLHSVVAAVDIDNPEVVAIHPYAYRCCPVDNKAVVGNIPAHILLSDGDAVGVSMTVVSWLHRSQGRRSELLSQCEHVVCEGDVRARQWAPRYALQAHPQLLVLVRVVA